MNLADHVMYISWFSSSVLFQFGFNLVITFAFIWSLVFWLHRPVRDYITIRGNELHNKITNLLILFKITKSIFSFLFSYISTFLLKKNSGFKQFVTRRRLGAAACTAQCGEPSVSRSIDFGQKIGSTDFWTKSYIRFNDQVPTPLPIAGLFCHFCGGWFGRLDADSPRTTMGLCLIV